MQDLLITLRNKYGQGLSRSQKAHIERIIKEFARQAYYKYAAGVREHGGDLLKKSIVPWEIQSEAVDLVIYAQTLIEQLKKNKIVLGDTSLQD